MLVSCEVDRMGVNMYSEYVQCTYYYYLNT